MLPTTLPDDPLSLEELALAARNRGMPLEALRYDVTPTGLHYLLIHLDIPFVDPGMWRLVGGGAGGRPFCLASDGPHPLAQAALGLALGWAVNGPARFRPRPLS